MMNLRRPGTDLTGTTEEDWRAVLAEVICMHNVDPKSGGKWGLNYVYIFPGAGTFGS